MVTVIMRDVWESRVLELPDYSYFSVSMMFNEIHFDNKVIMRQREETCFLFPAFTVHIFEHSKTSDDWLFPRNKMYIYIMCRCIVIICWVWNVKRRTCLCWGSTLTCWSPKQKVLPWKRCILVEKRPFCSVSTTKLDLHSTQVRLRHQPIVYRTVLHM